MSRGLIFVRHAMPEVVPGVSSTLWRLGESAREDCVLLAHALDLPLASPILASGQPKVDETAAIIAMRRGLTTRVDPRVREVEQPAAWFDGDYRTVAAAYLAGDNPHGWEPREHVAARFAAAVDQAMAADGTGDVVVVNHGLAMSLYLAALTPVIREGGGGREFDLVAFWRGLTFPDAWRYDPAATELERLWDGGMAPE
ncbi:MAG: histidine phosphatase family protein [Chloroflexi bacterium]|nr:histidine phosphatase family protein [Chloroflexota bacterium]